MGFIERWQMSRPAWQAFHRDALIGARDQADRNLASANSAIAERDEAREQLRGAVEDLLTFAQAVLDLPCAFGSEGDPLAAQQRRAADLINTYRGQ